MRASKVAEQRDKRFKTRQVSLYVDASDRRQMVVALDWIDSALSSPALMTSLLFVRIFALRRFLRRWY